MELSVSFSAMLTTAQLVLAMSLLSATPKIFEDWTVQLGSPANASEEATAFFLGGFTPQDGSFFISGPQASLSKRLISTGEPVWTTPLNGTSQSLWTLDENYLYGGDAKGFVYKISAVSGKVMWSTPSKGVFFSAPLVRDGYLWIVNSYGSLQCFSSESGELKWQQADPKDTNLGLWSSQGPVYFNGYILAGFPSGLLQAYEPLTGKRIWTESFGLAVSEGLGLNDVKSISTDGSYLIASSFSGNLKAWKQVGSSMTLMWEKRISLFAPATIDSASETIYVADRDGLVKALDLQNGFVKWEFRLDEGYATKISLTRDSLWFGSSSAKVYVVGKDGLLISKTKSFETGIENAPLIIEENSALVLTHRGILRRLRKMDI